MPPSYVKLSQNTSQRAIMIGAKCPYHVPDVELCPIKFYGWTRVSVRMSDSCLALSRDAWFFMDCFSCIFLC